MRIKKIKIPIYKMRVTFIETFDKNKLVNYFKKINYVFENNEIFAHMISHFRKENDKEYYCIYLIFNCKNEYSKLTYGAISHESCHAADAIFNYIGKGSTEESYSYLVEYLVGEACKFLNIKNIIN